MWMTLEWERPERRWIPWWETWKEVDWRTGCVPNTRSTTVPTRKMEKFISLYDSWTTAKKRPTSGRIHIRGDIALGQWWDDISSKASMFNVQIKSEESRRTSCRKRHRCQTLAHARRSGYLFRMNDPLFAFHASFCIPYIQAELFTQWKEVIKGKIRHCILSSARMQTQVIRVNRVIASAL